MSKMRERIVLLTAAMIIAARKPLPLGSIAEMRIMKKINLWRHYGVGKVEFGKPSFN
jgi:hypothetical protein